MEAPVPVLDEVRPECHEGEIDEQAQDMSPRQNMEKPKAPNCTAKLTLAPVSDISDAPDNIQKPKSMTHVKKDARKKKDKQLVKRKDSARARQVAFVNRKYMC